MRMTYRSFVVVIVALVLLAPPLGGCQYVPTWLKPSAGNGAEADATTQPAAAAETAAKPPAKKKEPETPLYDRLGGEKTIAALVDDFVNTAAADPKVNFTRAGTPHPWQATPENVELFKGRLVEFLGTATGGPQKYHGQDMVTAHKGMNITPAEFDAAVADFSASAEKLNVPPAERKELLELVQSTRAAMVAEK